MEAMMEMLRTNAPVAAMFLLAVFYLSNENQEIRAEIAALSERTAEDTANLGERLARVETKVEYNEQRLIRIEQILDGLQRFDMPETESPN